MYLYGVYGPLLLLRAGTLSISSHLSPVTPDRLTGRVSISMCPAHIMMPYGSRSSIVWVGMYGYCGRRRFALFAGPQPYTVRGR